MTAEVLLLLLIFISLLLVNTPVAVCIGLATVATIGALGTVPTGFLTAQRLAAGISSFSLLAIPFFILAGILMAEGGMARRLMDFAFALVGRFSGGLAYVTTLTCMLFGAVSGSATAAVSSIGGFMIPEMVSKGYRREFAVALTATSATTGLLIPPSNIMIVYAVVAGNVSVVTLFLGGVLPGILVGLAIMAASFVINVRRPVAPPARSALPALWPALRGALPSLLLVALVLGGILGGVFSATEASAISVAYALVLGLGVYREVKLAALPGILVRAAKTTSVVMLLVGTSQAMSWVLAYESIPQSVSRGLLALSSDPWMILLLINILLLLVGTFMDMTPAVLIFTPILLPVVTSFGMDPAHFGIVLIANLCIGLCTPPVGTCLFVGCGIGGTTIARTTVPAIPFFLAMTGTLMAITYLPGLTLWLPRWLGL